MTRKIRQDGQQRQTNKAVLRELLKEREDAVNADSSLLQVDRWTLSTTFYRLRLRLIQMGLQVKTRKYLTESIKDICDEMGYQRHELGIIAAARAVFDFRDESIAVGFDEIGYCAQKGTDVIIIEKEGVAEVLGPYAKKYGIALLYTRGFASEYAMELSGATDSNIAILTDFDASGLLISKKIEEENYHQNIKWIGVNPEMLEALELNIVDVQEGTLLIPGITAPLPGFPAQGGDSWLQSWLPYLKTTRVEIDSVQAAVGTERLWNYIFEYLKKELPTRDYNRSITVPDTVMPRACHLFWEFFKNKVADIQEPTQLEIKQELQETEGFLEVEEKEAEIREAFIDALTESDEYKSAIDDAGDNVRAEFIMMSDAVTEFFGFTDEEMSKYDDDDDDEDDDENEDDDDDDDTTATTDEQSTNEKEE